MVAPGSDSGISNLIKQLNKLVYVEKVRAAACVLPRLHVCRRALRCTVCAACAVQLHAGLALPS